MLIVCPNCATSYEVDLASLRPNGRQVRCVHCRTVWRCELPHSEKLIVAAEALAPMRRTVETMLAPAEAAAEASAPPPEQAVSDAEPGPPGEETAPEPTAGGPASDSADSAETVAEDTAVETASPPLAPAEPTDQPPIEPGAEQQAAAIAKAAEDIETVAARRYPGRLKRQAWRWPLSHLQSAILALIVVNAIIVGWRADFVRAMPQTASFYALLGLPVNLRGLDFDKLTTATEQHDGMPILVISGDIVNATNKSEDVPHLRFAVRNAARQEIYSWTAVPSRAVLPPGEAVAFHTRLASPPPDAHDVLVRFVNRYDVMTGFR